MTTDRKTQTAERRGRPRIAGTLNCDRCGRDCNKIAVHWTEGAICGICFTHATHSHGTCPSCATTRMLPGLDGTGRRICVDCAGIPTDFHCTTCGEEQPRYRKAICVRCSLRTDLKRLLSPGIAAPSPTASALLESLTQADRPESIFTWMRNPAVTNLLTRLGTGALSPDHGSFDALSPGKHVEHLRAILIEAGQLPPRDDALARFERWLTDKLAPITNDSIRHPVERDC